MTASTPHPLLLAQVCMFLAHGLGHISETNENGLAVFTPYGANPMNSVKFIGQGSIADVNVKHIHVLSLTRRNSLPGAKSPDRLDCKTFNKSQRGYQAWWSVAAPEYFNQEQMQNALNGLRTQIPDVAACSFSELEAFLNNQDSPIDEKTRTGALTMIQVLREAKLNANKRLPWDTSSLADRFNLDAMFILYRSSASENEPGALWTNGRSERSRTANPNSNLPTGMDSGY